MLCQIYCQIRMDGSFWISSYECFVAFPIQSQHQLLWSARVQRDYPSCAHLERALSMMMLSRELHNTVQCGESAKRQQKSIKIGSSNARLGTNAMNTSQIKCAYGKW